MDDVEAILGTEADIEHSRRCTAPRPSTIFKLHRSSQWLPNPSALLLDEIKVYQHKSIDKMYIWSTYPDPMSQLNTTATDKDKYRADKVRQKFGRFRILIIGRANAGKTSILQKVCNTTEQAEIFNSKGKKVRMLWIKYCIGADHGRADRCLSRGALCRCKLPSVADRDYELVFGQRGLHDIENEMVFRSNPGFIFHDSRGFEAGGKAELNAVKDFVTRRSKEKDLGRQVHAIW